MKLTDITWTAIDSKASFAGTEGSQPLTYADRPARLFRNDGTYYLNFQDISPLDVQRPERPEHGKKPTIVITDYVEQPHPHGKFLSEAEIETVLADCTPA